MLMLLFCVGNEQFVMDCDPIVEIFPKVNLKVVSHLSPSIVGLMNYGGIFVPVLDTSLLIGGVLSENALDTRIVLVTHEGLKNGGFLGLICQKAIATIELDKQQFVSAGTSVEQKPFLGGFYSGGVQPIQYFDVTKVSVL